jgi:succinyl-diaminopimelate desuccinylase
MSPTDYYAALDAWIDANFDAEVAFLQTLVRCPTDTPPGDNAPHAELTAKLLTDMGLKVEQHPVPAEAVHAQGLRSLTNLIVRHRFGVGQTVALNAHGDVVPPGTGWTHDPYGGEIVDGKLYGRAAAVSKSDFATYTFALRALQSLGRPLRGAVELHFTYDEEFGGELGPGWLLQQGLTAPDYVIAAGFAYQVMTAHNGCLQMEVTLTGQATHAAYPETGIDALKAAADLLTALYAHNASLKLRPSACHGIAHPYLNVGRIAGGSHTNVVPGEVVLQLDRRIIPEEHSLAVEAEVRELINANVRTHHPKVKVSLRRLALAHPLHPDSRNEPLVSALQRHGLEVMGEVLQEAGTPLYTDGRLYASADVQVAAYGAGPRTVLESNAKRADEHLVLEDLRKATKVVARTLFDLLT